MKGPEQAEPTVHGPEQAEPTVEGPERAEPTVEGPERAEPVVPPVDRTLTELLGPGAHEDERRTGIWLLGLVAVVFFLVLVGALFGQLSPR